MGNIFSEITKYLRKLSGGSGVIIVSDTNVHTINFDNIVVLTDTVIAALYVDGVSVLKTANADSPYNLASVTIPANTVIPAPSGKTFTAIDLTSGSVILYLK